MLENIRLATAQDFDSVWKLYADVCDQIPHDRYSPGWIIGIFPSEDIIRSAIDAETLRVATLDGRIGAAMVLSPEDDDGHASVSWPSGASAQECSAIHLLAVHPSLRGRGIGAELVREAIRASREWGKRAIRLDVMPGNLAASRIYLREGFAYVCNHAMFYEDVGTISFEMYELIL